MFELQFITIFSPTKHMAEKICYNVDLLVFYVHKQFLYRVCILIFFILQHIHARIYKVHINSNKTYIRQL
jgi:hypothetical protein